MSTEATQETVQATEVEVEQTQAPELAPEVEAAAPSDNDDAAFAQGFDAARGVEPEPEPEPVRIAGYTEEELREILEKAKEVDKLREREAKVFGTLGSLKQAIDQLKQQPSAVTTVALNGQLKRLSAEFPEMAEMLQEDLKEALGSGAAAAPESVDKLLSERLDATSKTYEQKLLTVMHPDWRGIYADKAFEQWKGTLPPDELQIVESSWDAISVGEALTKFKAWRDQSAQAKQARQTRLEAAVTPKGGRAMPSVATEEDAFVAGFKRARGIR